MKMLLLLFSLNVFANFGTEMSVSGKVHSINKDIVTIVNNEAFIKVPRRSIAQQDPLITGKTEVTAMLKAKDFFRLNFKKSAKDSP